MPKKKPPTKQNKTKKKNKEKNPQTNLLVPQKLKYVKDIVS